MQMLPYLDVFQMLGKLKCRNWSFLFGLGDEVVLCSVSSLLSLLPIVPVLSDEIQSNNCFVGGGGQNLCGIDINVLKN